MGNTIDQNFSYRAALEDIKATYHRQSERFLISRDIAKTILTSASVIVSVFGAFSSFREIISQPSLLKLSMIIAAGVFFALLVLTCVSLLFPSSFMGPIKASQETYEKEVFDKNEKDTILIFFSAYLNAVNKNEPKIRTRNKWVWTAGILLILVVVCLLAYTVII
ncbi:MAG: hypothetical protein FP831_19410 [Anaerolineae bacterium]|nr:hypothetical protein [Anaerolineae bacterium]